MPVNGFSVGRDVSLTIYTPGGILGTAALTSFETQQITAEIKDVRMTGEAIYAYLPEGWQGTFEFTRVDASLDTYFANAEAGYYAGSAISSATITETITNPDGSVNVFRYSKVALKFDSPGTWKGNTEVKQKVSWMATRRRQVS